MNYIKQEMIDKGADGVIFHPIFTSNEEIFKKIICEYTIDTIDDVSQIPKSGRTYYKIIDGKKILL